jgi:twitching motility protein PilT
MILDELLHTMIQRKASDLHLKVGRPPGLRIHGSLAPLPEASPLTPEDLEETVDKMIPSEHREKFDSGSELDFSYSVPGLARFRVNIFRQRNQLGAVLRAIPLKILTLEELGFSHILTELASKPRGLVLVVGPTGSGKTTTLAAMIDRINSHQNAHILTVEDPIEFWHEDKMSFVNQRQVGHDTASFSSALKYALREDPDVILVGEMRDLETTTAAVTAAETGHLVFATLHTTSAAQTIDRIIDIYPPGQQAQIRMQLSMALQGVVSQALLPRRDGKGRVCAMEILIGTPAVRNLIREGKTHELDSIIQTSANDGMQTLEDHLRQLYQKNLITRDVALGAANNQDGLERRLTMSAPAAAPALGRRRF